MNFFTTVTGTACGHLTRIETEISVLPSEIINSTVHAFLVLALTEQPGGYRLYWAIYVRPVGRITAWYMRLIDPFRRLIIYPALLRHVRAAWTRGLD